MTKNWIIVLIALSLSACGTVATIPIDDAYYWPKEKASVEISSPVQRSNSETPAPSIEYLNVQDTTVTIRIKR